MDQFLKVALEEARVVQIRDYVQAYIHVIKNHDVVENGESR